MFGFAEEKGFKALIDAAAKQLAKDGQKEFKEAANWSCAHSTIWPSC